jgi:hypothetical protein
VLFAAVTAIAIDAAEMGALTNAPDRSAVRSSPKSSWAASAEIAGTERATELLARSVIQFTLLKSLRK